MWVRWFRESIIAYIDQIEWKYFEAHQGIY